MFTEATYGAPLARTLNCLAEFYEQKRVGGSQFAPLAPLPQDGGLFVADMLLMSGLYFWLSEIVAQARASKVFAEELGMVIPYRLVTAVHIVNRFDQCRALLLDGMAKAKAEALVSAAKAELASVCAAKPE